MQPKNILVALDFSVVSSDLIKKAKTLAGLLAARITLINVVNDALVPCGCNLGSGEASADLDAAEAEAMLRMSRCRTDEALPEEMCCSVVARGRPGCEIVRLAAKIGADYIIMGARGHSAFYDFVVGSTVRAVLKKAMCPVVLVNAPSPSLRRAMIGGFAS